MRRRVVLLVALGLVACSADQPTEPIYEGEGFRATLTPPPAPPTTLTASLPGADGNSVLMELGQWESPVLAKITISGLLSYSGLDGGWFPSSGQIDYQGRWSPSQGFCAMAVTIRVHNVGQVGGSAGCPDTWEGVGSFTQYNIVSGDIYAVRNPAPPGACYYGGNPCASITGTETVELTPIDGQLKLTTDTNAARAGSYIRADFAADPDTIDDNVMPWTLREVRWEGVGPVVGGGNPKACSIWTQSNWECLVQLFQSGYLVTEGIVSGQLRTTRVFLKVEGGAVQPPDSIPTDSVPGDSTHGGGGGNGGGGGGGCPAPVKGLSTAAPVDSSCAPSKPDSVRIIRFAVPSRGADSGSFTSNQGERRIRVYARAWPDSFSSRVRWRIADFPGDGFATALPTEFITDSGTVLEFDVPTQDTTRYAQFQDVRPLPDTSWKVKALGFRIIAYVTESDTAVTSKPFEVRQDELDVLREEYIELLAPRASGRNIVPTREVFSRLAPSFPGENDGESFFRMYRSQFRVGVDSIRTEFLKVPRDGFQINEVFRSPVDSLWHTADHDNDSWHMYGCAADLQTFPTGQTGSNDTTTVAYRRAVAYWTALAATARRLRFPVEDFDDSGVGHVHVQRNCYP